MRDFDGWPEASLGEGRHMRIRVQYEDGITTDALDSEQRRLEDEGWTDVERIVDEADISGFERMVVWYGERNER